VASASNRWELRYVVSDSVTPDFNQNDLGMMQATIQKGEGGGRVIVEDPGPVFNGLVGRDQGRAFLGVPADDLGEHVGPEVNG
jgi:hypothetical protein